MVGNEFAEYAIRLGIVDALVFRRSSAGWQLRGGLGAGERWGGVLDVSDADLVGVLPGDIGGIKRFHHRESTHIVGAFYARAGAVLRVREDAFVVVGNPRGGLAWDASDEALTWLAHSLDEGHIDVDPARTAAQDQHVERAVRAITATGRTDVWSILSHAADVAAAELGCEIAVVRDAAGRVGATSTWGSIDVCDMPVLHAALDDLGVSDTDEVTCLQNTHGHDLPEHFSWAQGTRSLMVIPIPGPVGGQLLVAHTMRTPRGFSDLCRRIGQEISDAIGIVAYAAMLRESQHEVADSHELAA